MKIKLRNVLTFFKFFLFSLAICLSISNMNERYNTNKTTTTTQHSDLSYMAFPLKVSVLVNPGFDQEELKAAGYESASGYFMGRSKYKKKNHFGWAGHTPEGGTIGNVSGKTHPRPDPKPKSDL